MMFKYIYTQIVVVFVVQKWAEVHVHHIHHHHLHHHGIPWHHPRHPWTHAHHPRHHSRTATTWKAATLRFDTKLSLEKLFQRNQKKSSLGDVLFSNLSKICVYIYIYISGSEPSSCSLNCVLAASQKSWKPIRKQYENKQNNIANSSRYLTSLAVFSDFSYCFWPGHPQPQAPGPGKNMKNQSKVHIISGRKIELLRLQLCSVHSLSCSLSFKLLKLCSYPLFFWIHGSSKQRHIHPWGIRPWGIPCRDILPWWDSHTRQQDH